MRVVLDLQEEVVLDCPVVDAVNKSVVFGKRQQWAAEPHSTDCI